MPSDAAEGTRQTRRAVLLASLVTISGIFGSRVLGLVRVMVQSSVFGAQQAGILRAAFDIPDLLFYIVAGGALRSGFVPVFTDLLTRSKNDPAQRERAWFLFSTLATLVTLASLVLVALGVLFARPLSLLVSGAWSDQGFSAESIEQVIALTRILLPAQVFLLVGGLLSGTLDSLRRFTVSALVPNFYNLAIIIAMLGWGRRYGISSAAWGVVFGALCGHLLWQGAALWRHGREHGFRFRPSLALADPLVVRVTKIAAPIVLGLCVAEINLKVSGWVMAPFGEAARNWFDNASRIARLPDGIFGAGFGIALFPFLSQLASEGKTAEFRHQAEQIVRLALVCSVPCAAVLIAVPHPLVDLIFGRGRYTAEDVLWTARLLPLFALGVVPITIQVVVTRAFYANHDSISPVKVGSLAVIFGVGANLLLGKLMGQYGPPLALSLTSAVNLAGLLWLYGRRFGYAEPGRLWSVFLRSLLGAALSSGVAALLVEATPELGRVVHTVAALGIGLGLYPVVLHLLRVEEIHEVTRMLRRRFGRRG
ncbi:MAG: murein biosynthesis integral membrane protein MurJ [Armatimonadetes bacterium]|nr:murein biosynthesis integral membrane protein MurJ [Armatimonadota bacterium]